MVADSTFLLNNQSRSLQMKFFLYNIIHSTDLTVHMHIFISNKANFRIKQTKIVSYKFLLCIVI